MCKRWLSCLLAFTLILGLTSGVSAADGGFSDVSADAYYAEPVQWAVEHDITNGTSNTTFSPDASCTRAQIVTFLWRYAGSPAVGSAVNPFADVASDSYYYSAVLWAVAQQITDGTSDTEFSPDAFCTRAQIVTFLYRFDESWAVDFLGDFRDVAADAYYADPVTWASAEDITSGTDVGVFSPDQTCTRAQAVTFLYRYQSYTQRLNGWDGKPLLGLNTSGMSDQELTTRIDQEIRQIIAPWTDADGYQKNDSAALDASGQAVYAWAQQLRQAGILASCTYNTNGHTVGFFLPSGSAYVYAPNIEDTYLGIGGTALTAWYHTVAISELTLLHSMSTAMQNKLATIMPDIDAGEYGSKAAASVIQENNKRYLKTNRGGQTFLKVRDFLSSLGDSDVRVIFWRGHGCVFTDSDNTEIACFFLHQKASERLRNNYSDEFRASDGTHRLITSDKNDIAVTSRFIDRYCAQVDGGLFFSGACQTGMDLNGGTESYTGRILLNKGFDAYVAPDNTIFNIKSDVIMYKAAEKLTQKDSADVYGRLYSIDKALSELRSEYAYLDGDAVNFQLFKNPDALPFRLIPSWQDLYEDAIMQYGAKYGSVYQLADLTGDHIPELMIGSAPGSGLFSQVSHVFTVQRGKLKELGFDKNKSPILPSEAYTIQSNFSGQTRIEGNYVLRAGAGNYSNCIATYAVENDQLVQQTVFVEETRSNHLTGQESKHYFVNGTETTKSDYDAQLRSWNSGWSKDILALGSKDTYMSKPNRSDARKFIQEYTALE